MNDCAWSAGVHFYYKACFHSLFDLMYVYITQDYLSKGDVLAKPSPQLRVSKLGLYLSTAIYGACFYRIRTQSHVGAIEMGHSTMMVLKQKEHSAESNCQTTSTVVEFY